MSPALVALVLVAGLLALIPTRRLAVRTEDRWIVLAYYVALAMVIGVAVLVPGLRRLAIPLMLVLAIAPWLTPRAGLRRLLGLPPAEQRRPPRNVTPPDA